MIPEHYSRDIAQRCKSLICNLRPRVQRGLPDDGQFGGPLGTTLLLALATPMIVLPIERIFKPTKPGNTQAGDDRQIDPALAREVSEVLDPAKAFGAAPFGAADRWSYVPGHPLFNIANNWPGDLLETLGTPAAFQRAQNAPAVRVLGDLRNSLAHGGIAYLDANGRQTAGQAAMLAFAGTKEDWRKGKRSVVGLNILRVREDDFCAFLMDWADWLTNSPISEALNRRDPLAA
jgi:hypothetical protein